MFFRVKLGHTTVVKNNLDVQNHNNTRVIWTYTLCVIFHDMAKFSGGVTTIYNSRGYVDKYIWMVVVFLC